MKIRYPFKILISLITVIYLCSYKKTKNPTAELTVGASTITFTAEGGTEQISVSGNADWSISNPAYSWLQLSVTSGNSGSTVIHLKTLSQNATMASRSGVLLLSLKNN